MRKFLKALGVAALLSVSFLGGSDEAHAEIAGATFTSVDDASATVCTTANNQTVTMFGSGTYDMVIALQREVGSPGSGAWATVAGFTDVFPTANAQTTDTYTAGLSGACYRLLVTTDTSGTTYYTLLSGRTTPTVWASTDANMRTHHRLFDDFHGGALAVTTGSSFASWLTTAGSDGDATVAVTLASPEGILEMGWGATGTDINNTACITLSLIGQFSLVSSGLTVMEARLHLDQVTSGIWNIGLTDTIAQTACDVVGFDTTSSNVYTEGAQTDLTDAAFIHTDEALVSANWMSGSLNGNTTQNGGIGFEATAGATASTYQIFRIEIDATGDAYYYLDGALFHAQTTAVATTAVLSPHIDAYNIGTSSAGDMEIDYIDFWAARPSG